MANRHSAFLIIGEMQITSTRGYHLTPFRVTIGKEIKDNHCWQGGGERGPLCTIGENVNQGNHCGNRMDVSQKIKHRTTL